MTILFPTKNFSGRKDLRAAYSQRLTRRGLVRTLSAAPDPRILQKETVIYYRKSRLLSYRFFGCSHFILHLSWSFFMVFFHGSSLSYNRGTVTDLVNENRNSLSLLVMPPFQDGFSFFIINQDESRFQVFWKFHPFFRIYL